MSEDSKTPSAVGGGGPRVRPPQEVCDWDIGPRCLDAWPDRPDCWCKGCLRAQLADLRGERQAMIDVAAEAIGTDQEMRNPGCVDALAHWSHQLRQELADLRGDRDAANVRHPPLDWTALLNRAAEAEQQVEKLRADAALPQQIARMVMTSMIDREQVWWQTLRAVMTAVIASPTRISDDPKVRAALDAALFTRARLRLEPLDGYTPRQLCDALITFWTAERDALGPD